MDPEQSPTTFEGRADHWDQRYLGAGEAAVSRCHGRATVTVELLGDVGVGERP